MKKIGIIGVGHLGSALLSGFIKSGYLKAEQIYISGGSSDKAKKLSEKYQCHFCASNLDLVNTCDILILAVIPRILPEVLNEIKSKLSSETIVVSAAASFTFEQFYQYLPSLTPIVRAIPNIPSAVCQGMTAISVSSQVNSAHFKLIEELFLAIGKTAIVEEKKLDICSTVAGCSPAYTALFVEALADAGVLAGLSREEAYLISKQAVLGSAAVMLENNMLPAELKDGVCSPGGMTIRGIAELEKQGLRNAVIEAVKASARIKNE